MFYGATLFSSDLSKWDVSRVASMDSMFSDAVSFKHKLCGPVWVHSKASKKDMFAGSFGSISRIVCTSAPTRQHVSRWPITERELLSRTPIITPVNMPAFAFAIAETLACPKCGIFGKSGRVSCCAPGGSWFQRCGGAGNKNADHKWFRGVEACKRKFKAICM